MVQIEILSLKGSGETTGMGFSLYAIKKNEAAHKMPQNKNLGK
jgi:hypothetical protein